MTETTRYLSCADTAKLLRQALKESFPSVKFSVRSRVYSGGASIDVKWTDGPTGTQVEPILNAFKGAYFDGMIDYKGSQYHALDGQPVRFGANFIFGERDYSDALLERAIAAVVNGYGGCEAITVEQYRKGGAWNWRNSGDCDLGRALQLWLSGAVQPGVTWMEPDAGLEPKPSPTLARVAFTGDDGYGQGTVGRNGSGGELCYKAIAEAQERSRFDAALAAAQGRLGIGVELKTSYYRQAVQNVESAAAGRRLDDENLELFA